MVYIWAPIMDWGRMKWVTGEIRLKKWGLTENLDKPWRRKKKKLWKVLINKSIFDKLTKTELKKLLECHQFPTANMGHIENNTAIWKFTKKSRKSRLLRALDWSRWCKVGRDGAEIFFVERHLIRPSRSPTSTWIWRFSGQDAKVSLCSILWTSPTKDTGE